MAGTPPPPPRGDIPRNLSYIAGLYERAYYRTARPSLADDSEDSEPEGRSRRSTRPRAPRLRTRRTRTRQSRRAHSAPPGPGAGAGGGSGRSRSPGARKRVRFADALGLELASVRQFWPAQLPEVPERVQAQLRRGSLSHFPPCLPYIKASSGAAPWAWAAAEAEVGARLAAQAVALEGARAEGVGVAGTLRVLDLAYEKRVSVRYTWDGWASKREAPAAYAGPAPPPPGACPPTAPGADRFAFRLPLPPPSATLEFALRYCAAGTEFWDNNEGHNYALRPTVPLAGSPRELPPSPLPLPDWSRFA
ncbi:protein phosphatase 1 regulatory subunit 3E [Alligator sinensis]|uniref:Protein phosphatase 1 regulatory subunit 3E n=1 Tax=Alligator sinensis TaxID=38654 RepID=A0A1U7SRC9_ALLSI|nr:protein phosphatase 1 regulatory subunit 3E [Alligator sinensis]